MKIRFCSVLLLVVLFVLFTPQVDAREWAIVGPRALGMGGAYVAVANDSTASYWNPAAYGFFKSKIGGDYGTRQSSSLLDVGVGTQIHEDLGERLDRILDYDFDTLNSWPVSANKVPDFLQLVNELKIFDENKDRAVMTLADAGIGTQVGHFGIGGYVFGEVSAKGDIDLVNIAPIAEGTTGADLIAQLSETSNYNEGSPVPSGDYYFQDSPETKAALITSIASLSNWTPTTATNFVQAVDYGLDQVPSDTIPSDIVTTVTNIAQLANDAQTGNSFADNESTLVFKGIAVFEFPITYGRAINDDFAVGGNVKFMKARVYNTSVKIFNNDFSDALDDAMDTYEDSQDFGLDLGLLYRFGDDLRIGLVGRDLNSPEFDMKPRFSGDDDSIKEKPQLRAGLAYKPQSTITLAMDLDLTKNDTTISGGYDSQNIALGLEFNAIDFLKLRAGCYKNISEGDIGLVYTAGLGFNFGPFNLDVGASMSGKSSEIDGNSTPKEARGELALSMLF